MSAIRGSLPELVARLEALDEQREALAAVIGQRLGLAPGPRRTQATQPQVVPRPQPRPKPAPVALKEDLRGQRGNRAAQILAIAKTHGTISAGLVGEALDLPRQRASDQLGLMAARGELIRRGKGQYALPHPRSPKTGAKRRATAGRGQRSAQILALGADLAKRGESLTPINVSEALGITANNAQVLMSNLQRVGKLMRVGTGIYTLPPPTSKDIEEAEPAVEVDDTSANDTDRAVALAVANGGTVDIAAVLAAGIKSKHALASVMLRKLHARGRLERVAPETYATPEKAAQLRASKRAERNSERTT